MKQYLSIIFCRVILNGNGDIKVLSNDGLLPVHVAAKHQALKCLKTFSEFSVDLGALDSTGL